jgi:hypothetical protein
MAMHLPEAKGTYVLIAFVAQSRFAARQRADSLPGAGVAQNRRKHVSYRLAVKSF